MQTEHLLARLAALTQLASEEEHSAPCGLRAEGIAACTESVLADCGLSRMDCCPRVQARKVRDERSSLKMRLEQRGVPLRVLGVAFDQAPKQTRSVAAVSAFLKDKNTFLVLSGPNQCGKTTAAGWAMIRSAAERPRARFQTAAAAANPHTLDELLRVVPKLDLFVLDDIGQTFFGASGFTQSVIERVVDAVYQGRGKAILCTDVALKAGSSTPFFDMVGLRVTSRLLQSGTVEGSLGGPFIDGGS